MRRVNNRPHCFPRHGLAAAPAAVDRARAAVSPADEATLQEAADLLNHKQPAEALAKLGPLRPTLAGEVDFNLVYGIALLETDKPRQAETAFRRALTVQPENLLARAHLARALAANGELDDARREIMVLRERDDLPPDVRAVMDNNLRRIDEARKQRAQAQARWRRRKLKPQRRPRVHPLANMTSR